ncbi:MAG: GNAT family N-acetyltransferase [Candidatus Nanohaloarchaea archaeon]
MDELWFSLALEMENVSQFNTLGDRRAIREASLEHKREKIQEDDTQVLLAREEDEPAGYVIVSVEERPPIFEIDRKAAVSEIFVKEDFRREGVATRLMDAAEEFGEEKDCAFLQLEVDVGNVPAQKFYQEHGFEVQRKKMVKEL